MYFKNWSIVVLAHLTLGNLCTICSSIFHLHFCEVLLVDLLVHIYSFSVKQDKTIVTVSIFCSNRVTFISNNTFGVESFSCSFRPSWFGSDPTRIHFIHGEMIHWLRGTWKSHSLLAANQTQGRTSPAIYLFLRKHYGSVVCPLSYQLWPTSSEFCINAHYKMLSEKISLVHAQIRQIKRWHFLCHYLDTDFLQLL